jgi:hypothetical protein
MTDAQNAAQVFKEIAERHLGENGLFSPVEDLDDAQDVHEVREEGGPGTDPQEGQEQG